MNTSASHTGDPTDAGAPEASPSRRPGDRRRGVVTKVLPRGLLEVALDGGATVAASLSFGAKTATVTIKPGERVELVLSPYDPTRARIERKL